MRKLLNEVPSELTAKLLEEFISGREYIISDSFQTQFSQFQESKGFRCVFGTGHTILIKESDIRIFPNFYFKIALISKEYLDDLYQYISCLKSFYSDFTQIQGFLTSIYSHIGEKKNISWEDYNSLVAYLLAKNIQHYEEALLFLKKNLSLTDEEILNLLNFLFDKKFRLEAKNPINGVDDEYILRADIFDSLVGKIYPITDTKHGNMLSILSVELFLEGSLLKILDKALILMGEIKNSNSVSTLKKAHNTIVYGAPGTGKSYSLEIEAGNCKKIRVTFNPEMTYGQFVGSYKPIMIEGSEDKNDKRISYELIPGKFLEALVEAHKNPSENIILIIEEINRANVSAVFGDVFQLLDRTEDGRSEYAISFSREIMSYLKDKSVISNLSDEVRIPSNLYIWASMNSADQGVYPMDSAFKRRWSFDYIGINDGEDVLIKNDLKMAVNSSILVDWNKFRRCLNDFLIKENALNVSEDKLIGPFFLSKNELLNNGFSGKLILYLWDDVLRHKNRNKLFKVQILSEFHTDYVKKESEVTNLINHLFAESFASQLLSELNS